MTNYSDRDDRKFKEFLEEAIEAIKDSSPQSSVYVGCDSIRYKVRRKSKEYKVRFSTVIILHINSKNGGKIFPFSFTTRDYGTKDNLKMRLMGEVAMATEVATAIVEHIGTRHMEVHIDVNPDENHASSVAVKEALGWSRGLGFETKIKPDGWAATHAADHAVRHIY